MKDWDVTIRGADGKTEIITISAESRHDVFVELAKMGKNAVRVEEAAGKKVRKPAKNSSSGKAKVKGVFAAIVVLVAVIAAWWMWPEEKKVVEEKKVSDKKVAIEKKSELPKQKRKQLPVKKVEPKLGPGEWLGSKVVKYSATTNVNSGRVLEVFFTADGRKHKRVIEKSRSPFKNVADEMISLVVTTPRGETMPAMPLYPGFENDFKKGLNEELIINEDDTDDIKEIKAQVLLVRDEIRERIANGESIRTILSEHESLWNENIEIRQRVQKELRELVYSGDADGAREYQEQMNKALEKFGLEPVSLPQNLKGLSKKEIMQIRKERQR